MSPRTRGASALGSATGAARPSSSRSRTAPSTGRGSTRQSSPTSGAGFAVAPPTGARPASASAADSPRSTGLTARSSVSSTTRRCGGTTSAEGPSSDIHGSRAAARGLAWPVLRLHEASSRGEKMRFGVASFLLLAAGCSAESVRQTLPVPPADGATITATEGSPAEMPSAVDATASPSRSASGSPRATAAPQGSQKAFHPALAERLVADCPIPASVCPAGCASINGWRLEEARSCYSPVVVACLPDVGGGYAVNSDLGCYKRDDGVIISTSPSTVGHRLGSGWSGCDPNEAFPEAPPCQ